MYYINTLKQELITAKTYEHNLLYERYHVDMHQSQMSAKFGIDKDDSKLPTLHWLPKLHKRSYKSCVVASYSSCTAAELSIP